MPEQSANAGPGSVPELVNYAMQPAKWPEPAAVPLAQHSPLTDAELDSAAHMWIESGHISVVRSKLIAEIRRLRAQVAGHKDWLANAQAKTDAMLEELGKRAEKPLAWTKEPPTEPGWYWFRTPSGFSQVVEVDETGMSFCGCETPSGLSDHEGQWAGPIRPPS